MCLPDAGAWVAWDSRRRDPSPPKPREQRTFFKYKYVVEVYSHQTAEKGVDPKGIHIIKSGVCKNMQTI